MSSLSINGLGNGLASFMQAIGPASSTPAKVSPTSASTTTSGAAPGGRRLHGSHHGSKMFSQIENAVTSALQAAQSGGASDPNQVIEDAISKVFRQTSAGGASAVSSAKTSGSPAVGLDGIGDADDSGATDAGNPSNPAHQAFLSTLRSFGVTPQQFQSDFLSAIKDAQQTGHVDVSSALRSLPPGSALDVIA